VTSSTTVGSRGHAAGATDTMQVDMSLPIAADPIQVDQSPISSLPPPSASLSLLAFYPAHRVALPLPFCAHLAETLSLSPSRSIRLGSSSRDPIAAASP
jgi:hypothetical protein